MVDKYNSNDSLKSLAGRSGNNIQTGNSNEFLHKNILPLEVVERQAIEKAIALCGGNIPKAAVFLDVAPSTIYRKMKQWEKQ